MKTMRILAIAIFFSLLPAAQAADFWSPRTAALGGSGHAGPLLNDAIYLNPSFVSFLPTYSMSGNYLFYKSTEEFHGAAWNASIQDGRSEMFQAGAGYTQAYDYRIVNVGASRSVVNRFGLGIGGKFLLPKDSRGLVRDAVVSTTFIASDWLQVVGVVDNVFASEEGRARGLYREFILGTKLNVQGIVLIYFDPHETMELPTGSGFGYNSGLEFPILSDFFFRLGMFHGSKVPWASVEGVAYRGNGYGIGAGWIAPRMSVDFGISRLVDPVAATSYNFGLTIFF